MTTVLFWFFALAAIVGSLGVILTRNPIRGALWLVSSLFCMAVMFVLLDAHLLAALEVLVYAGAVMVLFLFVIMLLNLREEELGPRRFTLAKLFGVVASVYLAFVLVMPMYSVGKATPLTPDAEAKGLATLAALLTGRQADLMACNTENLDGVRTHVEIGAAGNFASVDAMGAQTDSKECVERVVKSLPGNSFKGDRALSADAWVIFKPEFKISAAPAFGTVEAVGMVVFRDYLLPFELTSILLLAAVVGAVALAKRKV